jgi:hypothetical protein
MGNYLTNRCGLNAINLIVSLSLWVIIHFNQNQLRRFKAFRFISATFHEEGDVETEKLIYNFWELLLIIQFSLFVVRLSLFTNISVI